jgi:hypothetical protein
MSLHRYNDDQIYHMSLCRRRRLVITISHLLRRRYRDDLLVITIHRYSYSSLSAYILVIIVITTPIIVIAIHKHRHDGYWHHRHDDGK